MPSRLIVNASRPMGFHLMARIGRAFAELFALFAALMLMSLAPMLGQETSPSGIAIRGTVRDSADKPVGSAVVRLAQDGSSAVATTNAQGEFEFQHVRVGNYRISAEKSGFRSREIAVPAPADRNISHINLVLESTTGQTKSEADSQPSETMAFADKPDFTVAGITDWTAVGGHGSDVTLRTSESLARDTAILKPESTAGNAPVSGSTSATMETETRLRSALAEDPSSFEANHRLGEFCFHVGSYGEAIPPLETAYRIDPANHVNEYELALAYKETGDYVKARDHIRKLIAQDDNADLHRELGDLDEMAGDSFAAVNEYEQAVRVDPSEQNYFAWGSELLLHRAVWPAAEVFRKGAEAHPKSARMLAALGAALFASAKYDDAAARLCEASDLNPADSAPYIFLGKIDMAAPDPLSCVEPKLARFVQEQPRDARAKYYYAMAVLKRLKDSDTSPRLQVESLLTEAVTLDPEYSDAYLQLGNMQSDQRNFKKAIGFYLKAIDANPQLSDAHYRLGVAYERTAEPANARHEFELHDEIEKEQAAAVERQRQEVKQFLVVLQNQPAIR